MSNFYDRTNAKNKEKYNNYITPNSAWNSIKHLLPKDKIIYEPFYNEGSSGKYLTELGFNVIHKPIDFYEYATKLEYDLIVSNPDFENCKKLFNFLFELDKPFILILPCSKLHTHYLKKHLIDKKIQILVPHRRIHFIKTIDSIAVKDWVKGTCFDCYYYCYKMNFERDIVFLD
jgi:hypothetical protein|tara:strand:- start:503 stop:1024 length:522 start_codon:yes stop_codon:yes gene_type:complete